MKTYLRIIEDKKIRICSHSNLILVFEDDILIDIKNSLKHFTKSIEWRHDFFQVVHISLGEDKETVLKALVEHHNKHAEEMRMKKSNVSFKFYSEEEILIERIKDRLQ